MAKKAEKAEVPLTLERAAVLLNRLQTQITLINIASEHLESRVRDVEEACFPLGK